MNIWILLGAFVITAILAGLFYYGFKSVGPWGSFWSFFLVLFLGITLVAVWVTPFGPVWYGVAWFDLFVIGLLIAMLLAVATPSSDKSRRRAYKQSDVVDEKVEGDAAVQLSAFFWILLVLLITVIGVGLWL